MKLYSATKCQLAIHKQSKRIPGGAPIITVPL